jgi:hypothetical protein
METGLKCRECDRKVKQTTHTSDSFKVDYYIVEGRPNTKPIVVCVDCIEENNNG